jgi:hypothetical protein
MRNKDNKFMEMQARLRLGECNDVSIRYNFVHEIDRYD